MTATEREIWNRAIRAAARACHRTDQACAGQGEQRRRPLAINAQLRNPHGHRSGDLSLGAMRAKDAVLELLK